MIKPEITLERAKQIGNELHVDWTQIDLEEFRLGLLEELEHGTRNAETNVTNDDQLITAKIALAHLKEIPDYYRRLHKMERRANRHWNRKKRSEEEKENARRTILSYRDEIAGWRNKMAAVEREISVLIEEVRQTDFTTLKKSFATKAADFQHTFEKWLGKFSELKSDIDEFEKKTEEQFSNGNIRVRTSTGRKKEKLDRLLNAFSEFFNREKKDFRSFLNDVQKEKMKEMRLRRQSDSTARIAGQEK